jgi:hypothetical protein
VPHYTTLQKASRRLLCSSFARWLNPQKRVTIKHLLTDAGYDSESNHRYAKEVHKIKTTIPPKHGRPTMAGRNSFQHDKTKLRQCPQSQTLLVSMPLNDAAGINPQPGNYPTCKRAFLQSMSDTFNFLTPLNNY